MPRTALVTGATGFVGSALVPRLLDAGWNVRVLARHPERLDAAWSGRVEVVTGELAVADRAADLLEAGPGVGQRDARQEGRISEFAARLDVVLAVGERAFKPGSEVR